MTFFLFQNFSTVEQKKLNTDYNDLFKANPQNCRPKNNCELYNLQAKSFTKDLKEAIKEIKKKKDPRTISYMNVIGKEVKLVRTLEQWQSIYFKDMKNIVFDGNNALFINANENTFLGLKKCVNCLIKNIRVKQREDLYVQGKIISFDDKSAIIRVDKGYKALVLPKIPINRNTVAVGKPHIVGATFVKNKKGGKWGFIDGTVNRPHFEMSSIDNVPKDNRLIKLNFILDKKGHKRLKAYKDLMQSHDLKFAFTIPIIDREKTKKVPEDSTKVSGSGYFYSHLSHNVAFRNIQT